MWPNVVISVAYISHMCYPQNKIFQVIADYRNSKRFMVLAFYALQNTSNDINQLKYA